VVAVVLAEVGGELEEQLPAQHFVAVHVGDVLDLGLASLVHQRVVGDDHGVQVLAGDTLADRVDFEDGGALVL